MIKKVSWIKANVSDAVVAKLVDKLSKSNSIETGDCGCGAEVANTRTKPA